MEVVREITGALSRFFGIAQNGRLGQHWLTGAGLTCPGFVRRPIRDAAGEATTGLRVGHPCGTRAHKQPQTRMDSDMRASRLIVSAQFMRIRALVAWIEGNSH